MGNRPAKKIVLLVHNLAPYVRSEKRVGDSLGIGSGYSAVFSALSQHARLDRAQLNLLFGESSSHTKR